MSVTLENLELTPQELESCKDIVRRMAYFHWLDAGQPEGAELDSWLKAESEWFEHDYVPYRSLDGTRPEPENEPLRPDHEKKHRDHRSQKHHGKSVSN